MFYSEDDKYRGAYGFCSNVVNVAGKRPTKLEVQGTLLHEITHFVTHEVYLNNALPYFSHDPVNSKLYLQIINDVATRHVNKNDLPAIIGAVFYSYPYYQWGQELIVRVAQIVVHGGIELQELKAKAPE